MPSILITGANRGIGLALARGYLARNWQVHACCRQPREAEELQRLAADDGALRVHALDVTNPREIARVADELAGEPLDVLVNNAGIIGPVPVAEHIERQHFGSIDYALWETVLRTNTFGPVRMAEAFLPHLRAGGQKKIVTLSSTVGSITERATPAFAYATSKTAVNKAMTLLAAVLREEGIVVALVCPGYVKTRMDFGTADVEVSDSAAGIMTLIDGYTLADTGSFRRYNGETVAW